MRRFIGGLVLFMVVFAVLVAVAASNLNTYLNDNKDWVAEQVEAALVRPVSFEEVGLSFSRGLGVMVRDFRVGEDPDYGDGDFLQVGRAEVRVAIWPALFGRIEVTKISLRDVSLSVVQDVFGFSTDSLGGTSDPNAPASEPQATEPSDDEASALVIALAEIRSGTLRYVDRTTDPVSEVVIDRLEFSTSDVGRGRPLDFQLMGEVLGEENSNLSIRGRFGPPPTIAGAPTPIDVAFSLDPILVSELRSLPGLGQAIDPELPIEGTMNLSGRVSGSVESPQLELELDATDALLSWAEDGKKERGAPLDLVFDVALAERDVAIRSADLQFEGIRLHAEGKVVNLDDPTVDLLIEVFGGKIEVDGGWSADGALALDAAIDSLELGEMTRSLAGEAAEIFDGRLDMKLAFTGQGTGWEELEPSLEGLGSASISGGVLHDINLVEEALSGFTGIPGLSSTLSDKLGDKYPRLFSSGDTEFDRMDARVEVREGRVHILGIEMDTADFGLRGLGSVSLGGELDMTTRLALSKAISDDLIDEAKLLKHLRDDDKRIEIPISIRGSLPDVKARPDTDEIAKNLGAGATKGLADKAVDKAYDKSLGKLFKKSKKKKKKKSDVPDVDPVEQIENEAPASADEDERELLESLLK